MKDNLRKIAVDAYGKNTNPQQLAYRLEHEIQGLSNTRAKAIARTETMRANNLSNYANAKINMGAKSYRVISAPDCCEDCKETYQDGYLWFDIDDLEHFPPLHPNCRCTVVFSTKTAEENNGIFDTGDEELDKELDRQLRGYGNNIKLTNDNITEHISESNQSIQKFKEFTYAPNGDFTDMSKSVKIYIEDNFFKDQMADELKFAVKNYEKLTPSYSSSLHEIFMPENPIRFAGYFEHTHPNRIYIFRDFIRNDYSLMEHTFFHEGTHMMDGISFGISKGGFKNVFMNHAENNLDNTLFNKFKRITENRSGYNSLTQAEKRKINDVFSSDYGYESWEYFVKRNPNFHGTAFSEELADSVGTIVSGRLENRAVNEEIIQYILNNVWI